MCSSDLAYGSDVHFVNDVMPDGIVGKHHIIASFGEQHHYAKYNITFASAKTSLTEKERTFRLQTDLFSLSAYYKGLGLAHNAFDRSKAMLALLSKCKFSAKDIILSQEGFLCYTFVSTTAVRLGR